MGLSFSTTGVGALAKTTEGKRRRVLVTGAAGRIGSFFTEYAQGKYDFRLMVQTEADIEKMQHLGETHACDLSDLAGLRTLCTGVDTVVHMAGNPDASATWRDLLTPNVLGVYNIMAAAKSAGCRRLIFASSIHAVSGYPADSQVKTSEPVNPGDLYGVTKCFGEALGRYMAEQEGLSVIALRIGGFTDVDFFANEHSVGMMDAMVSNRDLSQLIAKCIDVENLQFAIFHGLSNNRFNRLDISDARELVGYDPQDDTTQMNPKLKPLNLRSIYEHDLGSGGKSGLRDDV